MTLKMYFFLCKIDIAQLVLIIFVFLGRNTQHGNAGVCAPPAKRTRSQQPRIWPQISPLHRSLSHIHPHFCCFRGRSRAAAARAACKICAKGEFPSMSPLHEQQEGSVSHAWEGEVGGHVRSVWHRRAELSGVGPAHSHWGAKRGTDQVSGRDLIHFWCMNTWDLLFGISSTLSLICCCKWVLISYCRKVVRCCF